MDRERRRTMPMSIIPSATVRTNTPHARLTDKRVAILADDGEAGNAVGSRQETEKSIVAAVFGHMTFHIDLSRGGVPGDLAAHHRQHGFDVLDLVRRDCEVIAV